MENELLTAMESDVESSKSPILKTILLGQEEEDDRPFKCESCNFGFRTSSNLKEHINFYHKKGQVACSECTQTFATSSILRKHRIEHSLTAGRCPHCRVSISAVKSGGNLYRKHYTEHLLVCSRKPAKNSSMVQQMIKNMEEHGNENNNMGDQETITATPAKVVTAQIPEFITTINDMENSNQIDVSNVGKEQILNNLLSKECNNTIPEFDLIYRCMFCMQCFLSQQLLKDHRCYLELNDDSLKVTLEENSMPSTVISAPTVTWKCMDCGGYFSSMETLTEHDCRTETHKNRFALEEVEGKSEVSSFFCIVCDLRFRNDEELSSHLYEEHQGIESQEIDTTEQNMVVPTAPNVLYVLTNQ